MAKLTANEEKVIRKLFLDYMAWAIVPIPYRIARDTLRKIGLSYSLESEFLKNLQKNGDLKIENTVRFWGDQECKLPTSIHLQILWDLKDEDFSKFNDYPKSTLGWTAQQRVDNFRDVIFYWARTGKVRENHEIEELFDSAILELLNSMSFSTEWFGFFSQLPANMLQNFSENSFLSSMNRLEKLDEEYVSRVYRNNELINPNLRELFNEIYAFYDYILSDRIGEIPEQVTTFSDAGMCAYAFYAQYNGDYTKAIKLYQQALKSLEGNGFFLNPFYMMSYAIALMHEGSSASIKKMDVLSRKKEMRDNIYYMTARLILAIGLDKDVDEIVQWIRLNSIYHSNMSRWLFACIMKHYELGQLECKKLDEMVADEHFQLLRKFDTLLPSYRKLANWEKVLEQLVNLVGGKEKGAELDPLPKSQSRIVYNVNRYNQVFPRLQKSKDGINWSKGRNVALSTFKQCETESMTDMDCRIAACVKYYSGGYSIGDVYELGGAKVYSILAGYPFVYMDENPSIPVAIVKEEPQLIISKVDKGYKVSTNVEKLGQSSEILKKENDQLFKVIEVNAKQRSILETFKATSFFPLEAKDKLADLLGKLSNRITVHSDLIQNKENLKQVKGDSAITVQLQPVGDGIKVELFVKPFVNQPPYCKAGEGAGSVIGMQKDKRVQAKRNLKKEKENFSVMCEILKRVSLDSSVTDVVYFDDYYQCLDLIEELRIHTKISRTEWPEGAKLSIKSVAGFSQLSLSLRGAGYWFEVDGELELENGVNIKIAELLKKVRENKGRFIALGNSEFLALSKQLRQCLGELDMMMMNDKKLRISSANASLLTGLEQAGVALKKDKKFTDLQKRIEQAGNVQFEIPTTLQAELRNYQLDGFQWMSQLAYWGAGACLADDMGLGKTVQAIALMLARCKQGASLVVAPASVMLNWQNEIMRFAPSLNCHVLHDSGCDRAKMVKDASDHDIVLTTYGLLISEAELLSSKQWNIILLDEAHTIKNKETKMSKTAMTLNGEFRLLLTGTPIQNHLSEIWNLFQFINPGLLGSFSHFNENFINPIEKAGDKKCQKQLKKILQPFLLRRTKAEVLDELPKKTEIVQQVKLSQEEMALYENLRQQAVVNLEEGTSTSIQTLAELTRLRQAACHPALIDSRLELSSSKTQAFLELVEELIGGNHRSLVFSQFTSHLALIRKALDERNISYLYLDGSVAVNEREKLVRNFQQGEQPLFLISLKAGGTGLNLTAADYVIHLDPWWNPAVEDQASDRAYRIGQMRPVTIYRLISMQTIEEKIVELHQSKKSLADSLLDGSNMSHKLTKDEMLQLLKGNFRVG